MITVKVEKIIELKGEFIEEVRFPNTKLQNAIDFVVEKYGAYFSKYSAETCNLKYLRRYLKKNKIDHFSANINGNRYLITFFMSFEKPQKEYKSPKEKMLEKLQKALSNLKVEGWLFSEYDTYISKSSGKSVYLDVFAENLEDDEKSRIIKIRFSDHASGFSHNANILERQGIFQNEPDIDLRDIKDLGNKIDELLAESFLDVITFFHEKDIDE